MAKVALTNEHIDELIEINKAFSDYSVPTECPECGNEAHFSKDEAKKVVYYRCIKCREYVKMYNKDGKIVRETLVFPNK